MCMCVCTFVCVCMHVCVRACVHACVCVSVRFHVCMCMFVHVSDVGLAVQLLVTSLFAVIVVFHLSCSLYLNSVHHAELCFY